MAEILVVATDRPVPDSAGRWYRGMPVVVRPNGWKWGRMEGPPRFVRIVVPNLPVKDAEEFLAPDDDPDLVTGGKTRLRYARRRFCVPERLLSQAEKAGGTLTLDQIQSRDRFRTEALEVFPRDTQKRPAERV